MIFLSKLSHRKWELWLCTFDMIVCIRCLFSVCIGSKKCDFVLDIDHMPAHSGCMILTVH